MIRTLTLLYFFMYVYCSSSYGQMIYSIDTSSFELYRLPDSTTLLQGENTLRTNVNFRIQGGEDQGYLISRATDNPTFEMYDNNGNMNVLIHAKVNDSGGGIRLSDLENNRQDVIRLITNF